MTPSWVRPNSFWKAFTAVWVAVPNSPSMAMRGMEE